MMNKLITVVVCDRTITNVVGIPEGVEVKIIHADLDVSIAKIYQANGQYEVREVTEEEREEFLGEGEEEKEYSCFDCGWTGKGSELKTIVGDRAD